MPPPSKIQLLPDDVLAELNAKLKENGFGGYVALEEWLKSKGYEIGKSTIGRYGQDFKLKIDRMRLATEQAKFMAGELGDDAGALNDAILRQVQTKVFELLNDFEFDPAKIDGNKIGKLIVDLSRASVSQKRMAQEMREEARREAANNATKAARSQGLNKQTVDIIRRAVLGQEPD